MRKRSLGANVGAIRANDFPRQAEGPVDHDRFASGQPAQRGEAARWHHYSARLLSTAAIG
jgi:hypothetical protein